MAEYFKDKVVVVTGGTDGIGKALVDLLLAQGARVATCGRNHDKLYQLQSSHPSAHLHTTVADVSSENDCRRLIETTVKFFGGIDVLINNAGISMRALMTDVDIDVIRRVMETNFFGTVYCTKYALPYIIEKKGSIVGISSFAGYRGLPGRSAYSASKFAVNGWLEALRTELYHTGVNVMWVSPNFIATNIRQAALDSQGKPQMESPLDENTLMTAEECAERILKAIVKRKRTLLFSFADKRNVLFTRLFPRLADKMTYNFFFRDGKLIK